MNSFDEKMKVIEKLKKDVSEENLDPSFNITFRALNKNDYKEIPPEISKNIAVGMHHFRSVEKLYNIWWEDNRRLKLSEIKFPTIELEPPKDDVIQYTENW